jgi:protein TonB
VATPQPPVVESAPPVVAGPVTPSAPSASPPAAATPPPAPPVPGPASEAAPSRPPAAPAEAEPRAPASSPGGPESTATPGGAPAGGAPAGRSDAGASAGPGGHEGAALALAVPREGRGGDAGEYGAYLGLLRHRIFEAVRYPSVARRRGLTGTVQVELDIQPSGAISRVVVVASSSHRVLDDAAVEGVQQLGRLPFPAHVRPRLLRVRLPVVFELQ